MSSIMTQDKKMKQLLSRVGDDISQLRSDISSLVNHTGRHTIPESARDLRESALDRVHAGGEYAASQLRHLRSHPAQAGLGIAGGLVLLGVVGAGIYYLCKSDCCMPDENDDYEEEEGDFTENPLA